MDKFCNLFSIENNIYALVILCICGLTQNIIVAGANNVILTTIEKAFYMSSLESALFLAFYDIFNVISSPFIGFFGDKLNKSSIIALSMFGLSLGSFITAIPGFLNDPSNIYTSLINTTNNKCYIINDNFIKQNKSILEPSFECKNSFVNNLKYIFYIANAINGISSVALYTISISYIENIFSNKRAPICQAIYFAVGNLGVGIGMLTVSGLLNIDASFIYGNNKHSNYTNKSGNWIGAWWIIYLIISLANIILGILVWRFSLKLKKNVNKSMENKASKYILAKKWLYEFKTSSKEIISNASFVFVILCTTTEALIIKGYSSYLTKYIEYQFRLQTTWSVMLTGAIGFVSLVVGPLIGAFLIKRLSWGRNECIKFTFITLLVTTLLFLTLMTYCPQEKFINTPSFKSYSSYNPRLECNCEKNEYEPVCFKEKYIFQSSCFAGCLQKNGSTYLKCAQLETIENTTHSLAVVGCSRPANQCKHSLIIVSLGCTIVLSLSTIVIIPILKVILSCVNEDNQSFALGIRSLVNKLFGNLPGPLIFAAVIDSSCILWVNSSCKGNRTCRLYDNKQFSIGFSLLGACFRFVSACFAFIAYLFIRRIETKPLKNFSHISEIPENKINAGICDKVSLKNFTKI